MKSEAKILAKRMGFIDVTSNTINCAVQGIKRKDATNVESTHAWFAEHKKMSKAHRPTGIA